MDSPLPTDISFDVRPVVSNPAEMATLSGLFKSVWPQSTISRPECLDWLYFQNPRGNIIGFNAWHQGNLAAHYVVMPISAHYRGQIVPAALSLNTATHPNYQRRGLFVRLAEATYARAKELGAHHIIGVANANSTPGFLGKLAFQNVGPLDVHVGLGLPAVASDAAPADTTWRRDWSADDLRWRLRNPAGTYSTQKSGGRVAILSPTGTLGIQAVLKIEGDPRLAGAIREFAGSALALGPRLWMGLSRRIKAPVASMELPESFRKSPLNLIFRPLQDPSSTIEKGTTEFEALDFDAY